MFLDSDDYLECNACERVWQEIQPEPTDVVVFGTSTFPDTPPAPKWYAQTLHIQARRYRGFSPKSLFREPGAKPFVWRQAYRRKFFKAYGMRFDESVKFGEDTVFQMEALPLAENVSFIADRLYHYRWYHEGSLMSQFRFDLDGKIREHIFIAKTIAEFWEQQGWLELYGREFTEWLLNFTAGSLHNPQVKHSQEYFADLSKLVRKYNLYHHLDSVPPQLQICAAEIKDK